MRYAMIALLAITVSASSVLAHSNYTGYSGAPGRQTCASSCHGGSNGTVVVTGFPELYSPGTPYSITIARNGGNTIRNFNGSCRQGTGTANAGVLSGGQGTSTYSTTGESNGVHLSNSGQASATFTWTAPAVGTGPVRLYIAAYQGSSTNGQTTALTLVSAEGSPAVPSVSWEDLTVTSDDDGDGLPEGGETVEFTVSLRNTGLVRLNNVTGSLSSSSPYVQLLQPNSDWADIPAGQSRTSTSAFSLVVDPGITTDQVAPLNLALATDEGALDALWDLTLVFVPPLPPDLGAQDAVLLSDEDGDGSLEPGELGTIGLSLVNYGSQTATGLQASLVEYSPWLQVVSGASSCMDLDPDAVGPLVQPFVVRISENAPPIHDEVLVIQVQSDQGECTPMLSFPLGNREVVWADDMESGAPGWTHSAAEGWGDQWQVLEVGSGSPTHAWRCGRADGDYDDHLDARLETPDITLLPYSRLEIQHSMAAETSTAYPDSAYDGGTLEISADGGASWQQLMPLGAYTHSARWLTGAGNPTTHPFPGGTPCYSGTIGWEKVTFDLAQYGDSSSVRIRFRFGADDGSAFTGWTLDDVRIYGLHQEVAVQPALLPEGLELLPAVPNPFNPSTTVSWVQARAGMAQVEVFDLLGRRVLFFDGGWCSAGQHQLVLDGSELASGSYLLRVQAGNGQASRKILLVK